ncbi:PAS domain-containing protein [Ruegeria sp. 2012CJ41-6]|uniref:PAS domain-containing protein n=1 Tax=Ruegeria spongiae TaxID=2942209 RepID=A0ABT0PZM6_9RHOB|nr:PAS domain-containing protein [Ruegeria spongiae]MCL6282124.1 PAS domain-containing protein [Ruegeria spongiae]
MKPLARPAQLSGKGSKIVTLDSFRPRASLSPLRQAEAYWAALRQGDGVPKRAAIDPRGLSNLLQYAFILERVAPGLARFRLAGQHLTQLMDMEVSGVPLTALFAGPDRQAVSDHLTRLFDGPAIVDLTLCGQRRFGRKTPTARMILLPLRSECGNVDRALGVIVSEDASAKGIGQMHIETAHHRAISPELEPGRCAGTGATAPTRDRSGLRLEPVRET